MNERALQTNFLVKSVFKSRALFIPYCRNFETFAIFGILFYIHKNKTMYNIVNGDLPRKEK